MKIPTQIGTTRIRQHANGSFGIIRHNTTVEKFLDEHFNRCKNELRWVPKIENVEEFKNLLPDFEGKTCYIIGKGPSLNYLNKKHFPTNGPVIAINESIHKVETINMYNPTFMIQQDTSLKDTCRPKFATVLVASTAQNWYANYPKKLVFSRNNLGVAVGVTSEYAVVIAKELKVKKIVFLCFDAVTNGNVEYADIIPYLSTRGGPTDRFKKNGKMMLAHIGDIPYVFVTPKHPLKEDGDKPQQSQDNPEEHREHSDNPRSKKNKEKSD